MQLLHSLKKHLNIRAVEAEKHHNANSRGQVLEESLCAAVEETTNWATQGDGAPDHLARGRVLASLDLHAEPAPDDRRKADPRLGRREARVYIGARVNEPKRGEDLLEVAARVVEGDSVEGHAAPLVGALAESKHEHLGARCAPVSGVVVDPPSISLKGDAWLVPWGEARGARDQAMSKRGDGGE